MIIVLQGIHIVVYIISPVNNIISDNNIIVGPALLSSLLQVPAANTILMLRAMEEKYFCWWPVITY